MTFPIYYNGKILFRNGKPATSTNCCCGCFFTFPCCGPCWFPAPQDASRIFIPNPADQNFGTVTGGPSEITGYYQESINTSPVYAAQIFTQNGPSYYNVSRRFCYNDAQQQIQGSQIIWTMTSCQWFIPCWFQQYSPDPYTLITEGPLTQTVQVDVEGWKILSFAGILVPGLDPMDPNQCSGFFSQQGPEITVNDATGSTYVEFTASGGMPWPDGYSCGENGLLVRDGGTTPFRGPTSTFPPEFFPSGV